MVGFGKRYKGRQHRDHEPSCTDLEKKLLLALGAIIALTICSFVLDF